MYIPRGGAATTPAVREQTARVRAARERVPRNVYALGFVSLLTDVSAEMITSVVGYYLLVYLQVSTITVGFLDGLYSAIPVLLSLTAAYLADRYQRRKLLAGIGYGLSAVSKLGFPVVGRSVSGLGLVQGADRLGKGLRTAPRDALISLSTPASIQGRAFGVHRTMDTVGAFLGPLIAVVALGLSVAATAFDAVFVVSFCIATIGLLALLLLVADHREPAATPRKVPFRAALGLLADKEFRRVCLAATVLGVAWISDTFIYLVIQQRLALTAVQYALLAVGTSGSYLLLAVPAGRIADRIGRWRVFLCGHLALLVVYLLLAGPFGGPVLVCVTLAVHGFFYAMTDGVLMAHAGPMLPRELRTAGLALLQSVRALGAFVSSLAFGFAWSVMGSREVVGGYVVALLLALVAAACLVHPEKGTVPRP
ncbi:MFS transporter [Actinospica durhamensis]|uniref:MFS transporter n=1 Tax=Actinospica durhamensis TaxID=1508375 RepID=A0A941EMP0_9ACTN|nr:MFS transporter [Actinospica durhamensis]MBR7835235.1 MFS transporter [Actinospica durhamensis]